MTEIRFYHMEKTTLDQALPAITYKAWQAGNRVMIKVPDKKEAKRLGDLLWTFNPSVFLPNGVDGDSYPEKQPVWVTAGNDNPNQANVLILTHGCTYDDMGGFSLCCEILDGRLPDHIMAARVRRQNYKENGYDLTYWQQENNGQWHKKEKNS